jgi:threonine dehydrogenase-like Zn-dependent dehydrogenase
VAASTITPTTTKDTTTQLLQLASDVPDDDVAPMALLEAGKLDPAPLVSSHMKLDDAAEAYGIYDRRESLKIVLTP